MLNLQTEVAMGRPHCLMKLQLLGKRDLVVEMLRLKMIMTTWPLKINTMCKTYQFIIGKLLKLNVKYFCKNNILCLQLKSLLPI